MTSLENRTDCVDSIHSLLTSARAILTHTQQKLTQIYSRKGKQVITKHQYTLQPKLPPTKKRKKNQDTHSQHDDEDESSASEEDLFTLKDNVSTKNVDDVIASWRYGGEALTKEKIAIDEFIDTSLEGYEDVVRLHDKYDKLLGSYGELLMDKAESRMAVNILVNNMRILQEAIVEIHVQTHDVPDEVKSREDVGAIMRNLSNSFKSLKSKVPGVLFDLDGKIKREHKDENESEKIVVTETREVKTHTEVKEQNLVKFHDCKRLKCRYTLAGDGNIIYSLQAFELNGKQYLATTNCGAVIKIWDLSSTNISTNLYGHKGTVDALVLYAKNGEKLLVSGSQDKTIKLWDLSKNTNVQTLKGHKHGIRSLTMYEKDNKHYLVSGSYGSVMIWDLDSYNIIAKLSGQTKYINGLCVFCHDGKPYLASGSEDGIMKIWCLCEYSAKATIRCNMKIHSLVAVENNGKAIVLSENKMGTIKLWSMDSYTCLRTLKSFQTFGSSLALLQYHGKACMTTKGSEDLMEVIDVHSWEIISSLKIGHNTMIRVFMNGNEACLATADYEGKIQLWME